MKQKGFTAILIVLTLVLTSIIALAGGVYLKKTTEIKSENKASPSPQPTASPPNIASDSATLSLGDPRTWKTFTNSTYHYSIKYPDIFGVYEFSRDEVAKLDTRYGTNRISIDAHPETKDYKPFTCTTNIECQQELPSYAYSGPVSEQKKGVTRTILGQPIQGIDRMTFVASAKIPESSTSVKLTPVNYQYFAFVYKEKPYVIWLTNYHKSSSDLTYINSVYDTILSTLKFDQ